VSLTLEIVCADRLAAIAPLAGLPPVVGDACLDQQALELGM